MEYRKLGATGIDVSALVMGAWVFGGTSWGDPMDDKVAIATIHAAVDAGITMVDTAEGYGGGHSEEVVGAALAGKRDKMMISTKVYGNLTKTGVPSSLDASLSRLRTDYVDLYHIHWPNADVPLSETMEALVLAREQGKIRFIAVSNFSTDQIAEALTYGPVHSLQPPYSLYWRHIESAVLPYCLEREIAIMPYSPLAQGLLTGKYKADQVFGESDIRRINRLFIGETFQAACRGIESLRVTANDVGCSIAQLSLAWLLAQPGVTAPIVGARSVQQLQELLPAVGIRLSSEQIAAIGAIGDTVMATLDDDPKMWNA
jgi:aryl-alcohol dehydrogenase-like predicted oxidoreductase